VFSKISTRVSFFGKAESLFTEDSRELDPEYLVLRIENCRNFAKRYSRDMLLLMGAIFVKRVLLEPERGFLNFA
jgi:hypothetical protein